MIKAKAGMRLDAEGFALMQCVGDRGICTEISLRLPGVLNSLQYFIMHFFLQKSYNKIKHFAQLQYNHDTRSSAVAERPRALRVIEYFVKSLKFTQGHSK